MNPVKLRKVPQDPRWPKGKIARVMKALGRDFLGTEPQTYGRD